MPEKQSPKRKRQTELYHLIKKIKKETQSKDLTADQLEEIAAVALRAHSVMSNLNQGINTLANVLDRMVAYHFSVVENKPYSECVLNESDPDSLKKFADLLEKVYYTPEFQEADEKLRPEHFKAYQEKVTSFIQAEVKKQEESDVAPPTTSEDILKKSEEIWGSNPEMNELRKTFDKHRELTMRKLVDQILMYVRMGM